MDAYAQAKYRLFTMPGLESAVINVDDDWGARFAAQLHDAGPDVITYGTAGDARLRASAIALDEAGVRFELASEWGSGEVRVPVLGAFNVANLLAVVGTLVASGVAFDEALRAAGSLEPVPGRLERLGGGELPLVVVDYAHTPDALEKALEALRPVVAEGARLICVFGCGGDRDPGKRPIMGATAARLADHVIVTSDNPRSEDPKAIIDDVLEGIARRDAEALEDRQVAIFSAVHQARPGDVVLLAGKGHETYQEIRGTRIPFSDREVARAALAEWKRSS
jgi:UDP-N-acetylmuramoyl-L-alanyl-D-glutamate--2,6-diaminopimelate ligase